MKPTITEKQAVERVDRYVEEAMRAIGMGRLEEVDRSTGLCTHPDDGGPENRVVATASYFIRDVPVERNAAAFQAIREYWKRANFRVLDDTHDGYRSLGGENPDDGFGMRLRESSDGTRFLSLIVDSPCVWPNGTPEPTE